MAHISKIRLRKAAERGTAEPAVLLTNSLMMSAPILHIENILRDMWKKETGKAIRYDDGRKRR